jgi:hypothetical protein
MMQYNTKFEHSFMMQRYCGNKEGHSKSDVYIFTEWDIGNTSDDYLENVYVSYIKN